MPRHGKSTVDGQHWVYRLDGDRKCWFQAAEEIAPAKRRVHHHAAKHPVTAPAENEFARRKREAVVDARELLRSAPAETSQPTPPASELKVVDAASVLATVPVANGATDQLPPDRPPRRQVGLETVLAVAQAPSDAVAASVPPGSPLAFPIAEAGDAGRGRTASWLGMLLMALGLVSVLSSSRVFRGAVPLRQMK